MKRTRVEENEAGSSSSCMKIRRFQYDLSAEVYGSDESTDEESSDILADASIVEDIEDHHIHTLSITNRMILEASDRLTAPRDKKSGSKVLQEVLKYNNWADAANHADGIIVANAVNKLRTLKKNKDQLGYEEMIGKTAITVTRRTKKKFEDLKSRTARIERLKLAKNSLLDAFKKVVEEQQITADKDQRKLLTLFLNELQPDYKDVNKLYEQGKSTEEEITPLECVAVKELILELSTRQDEGLSHVSRHMLHAKYPSRQKRQLARKSRLVRCTKELPITLDNGRTVHMAVCGDYKELLAKSMKELQENGFVPPHVSNVLLVLKDGFDGAGGQVKVITREMSKLVSSGELELTKMELFGYVPLQLYDAGDENISLTKPAIKSGIFPHKELLNKDSLLWDNKLANSPKFFKPISLIVKREDHDLVAWIVDRYKDYLPSFDVAINDQNITIHTKICRSMLDTKVAKTMTGVGSQNHCHQCDYNVEEQHDIDIIKGGFTILYKNLRQLKRKFLQYSTDGETVDTKTYSSVERKGMTAKPVAAPVAGVCLHGLLNTVNHIIDLTSRAMTLEPIPETERKWELRGDTEDGTPIKEIFEANKKVLKNAILCHLGIHLSREPTTSVTGPHAREFLMRYKEVKTLPEIQFLGETFLTRLENLMERYYIILLVLRSKGRKVDVQQYRLFCTVTQIYVRKMFPWVRMSQTIHLLLGHSWEWIQGNNCEGLWNLSEEALESVQKKARNTRSNKCWLGDFEENLQQAFESLQLQGDMFLHKLAARPTRSGQTLTDTSDSFLRCEKEIKIWLMRLCDYTEDEAAADWRKD